MLLYLIVFLDQQSESPMEYPLPILSVCLFVYLFRIFFQSHFWKFSNFLRVRKISFLDFWTIKAQNRSKTRFYKLHKKLSHTISLLFYVKLQEHRVFKVIYTIFLKKSYLVMGFSGKKLPTWVQNEVFQLLWKSNTRNFFYFLLEVTVA